MIFIKDGLFTMPIKKLKKFLDSYCIRYTTIKHLQSYTAQETATITHIAGKELAKTVMVKIDSKMVMSVQPVSYMIDFDALKENIGAKTVELASEEEFRDLFSECEISAMSTFGNLYGMEVFVDESLAEDEEIAFNAGSHTELIKMAYKDFEKLVKLKIMRFSVKESLIQKK